MCAADVAESEIKRHVNNKPPLAHGRLRRPDGYLSVAAVPSRVIRQTDRRRVVTRPTRASSLLILRPSRQSVCVREELNRPPCTLYKYSFFFSVFFFYRNDKQALYTGGEGVALVAAGDSFLAVLFRARKPYIIILRLVPVFTDFKFI